MSESRSNDAGAPAAGAPAAAPPVWRVYMLACADGTLYTGITNDLDRRLAAHRRGTGSRYTRARLPVELAYEERLASRSSALRREAAIKRLPRREKQRLIESGRR